jgi:hypothetical protein
MASIHLDEKSKIYRIMFRFGKPPKQFQKSLDTSDLKKAEGMKGRIEETLRAIEQGWLTVPANSDFWQFVLSGGKFVAEPSVQDTLTLEKLFATYEEQMPSGAMEDNSFNTRQLHKKHLFRILKKTHLVETLTTTELQGYINKRAKEKYRLRPADHG